jgi:ABC-2 type transport system ATP-binding protein
MTEEADVLVADGVRKTYGDVVALDGVSLSVAAGEVFGLIGPNGAGKTTLVRAFTGTTDAEGAVRVHGVPPREVDSRRVGLLPQSFEPPTRLTPRELLDYYGGLYDDARPTRDVLADVGLEGDADRRYEALSGGQKRRLCVGTALVNDPDVLFLDEPTTGIDPAGRRAMWRLVDGLAAGGTTVLLTSHSMREVERLADRVGLLNAGELVAVGPPDDLVAAHGGAARLEVRTDATPDALAGTDLRVEATVEGLVVHDVATGEVGRTVRALEAAGVVYEALVWRRPGLEDAYLALTGEAFEGAGATGAREGVTNADGDADADGDAGAGGDGDGPLEATTDGGEGRRAEAAGDGRRGDRR